MSLFLEMSLVMSAGTFNDIPRLDKDLKTFPPTLTISVDALPIRFQYGIPGYRNPVATPYEIIYLSLKRAQERTNLPSHRFRPWLQAFKIIAFDGRYFNDKEDHGTDQGG